VATSTIDRLVDYVINTPEDGYTSSESVKKVYAIIDYNKKMQVKGGATLNTI